MPTQQTHYVAGFLFSPDRTEVALIRKNRPTWQAGKLNGIGGHVELNESPLEAMVREFREETGGGNINWRLFCCLTGENFVINFFVGFGDLTKLKSLTDEGVEIHPVQSIGRGTQCLNNLKWLVPLALDEDGVFAIVKDFTPNN